MKSKKRLYVDMDGTLAVFNNNIDKIERLYEKGYFLNLEPIYNVLNAIKEIKKNNFDIEVNILSSVLSDSKYALKEKNEWLDKYLPEIDKDHRLFPPCGANKRKYVIGGVSKNDYLLDDYTHNLSLWQPPGEGIKILNGINHTKKTWKNNCINFEKTSEKIAQDIKKIIYSNTIIIDKKPQKKHRELSL